jgi:hypothetical protein
MIKLGNLLKEIEVRVSDNYKPVNFNDWSWDNNYNMEIVFNNSPYNPNEILTQHDDEYIEPNNPESINFTKASFWENDMGGVSKIPQGYYEPGGVIRAYKLPDETWELSWDSGIISGFIEGDDFKFIPEEEIQQNEQ